MSTNNATSSSLASAVVLPSTSPSPPPNGSKRPHPDDPSEHPTWPKRQRTSQSPAPAQSPSLAPIAASTQVHPSRANKIAQPATTSKGPRKDETKDKRRNQRLFGALLGSGGHSSANSHTTTPTRRHEEQAERRKAAAAQRSHELEQRQLARLDKLNRERRIRQRRVDERDMNVRHEAMRAQAGFLKTRAEPEVFYLPWKLNDEEEEVVKKQRDEVEIRIDAELDDFAELKSKWREEGDGINDDGVGDAPKTTEGVESDVSRHVGDATLQVLQKTAEGSGESVLPLPDQPTVEEQRENDTEDQAPTPQVDGEALRLQQQDREEIERKGSVDDTDDVVVEGEEDTVIY